MSEDKTEKTETGDPKGKTSLGKGLGYAVNEPFCPVCSELGFKEKLHEVTGLQVVAKNPQEEKGLPRVIDCDGGCRFSLEPYFNPRSDGTFCYMLINSKRNPDAIVNHYWFKREWIEGTGEDTVHKGKVQADMSQGTNHRDPGTAPGK